MKSYMKNTLILIAVSLFSSAVFADTIVKNTSQKIQVITDSNGTVINRLAPGQEARVSNEVFNSGSVQSRLQNKTMVEVNLQRQQQFKQRLSNVRRSLHRN